MINFEDLAHNQPVPLNKYQMLDNEALGIIARAANSGMWFHLPELLTSLRKQMNEISGRSSV